MYCDLYESALPESIQIKLGAQLRAGHLLEVAAKLLHRQPRGALQPLRPKAEELRGP